MARVRHRRRCRSARAGITDHDRTGPAVRNSCSWDRLLSRITRLVPLLSGARNSQLSFEKLGAAHIAATVLLPRRDVIVRTVHLPGVSDRDLEAAIRLQIDSLHPFSEDEVYFSWAGSPAAPSFSSASLRREIVDRLSSTVCGSRHQGGSIYFFGCGYLFGGST